MQVTQSSPDTAVGGGVFLPDAWYDACDEVGIMVYHDMAVRALGAPW